MDEWLIECFENYNNLTPIQRLELQEEIDRLVVNGQMIVIHGYKSQGKSHIIDWLPGSSWEWEDDTNESNSAV